MNFDLAKRTAALSVGEFADFALGPREATGGPQGVWRAQLGTHWHNELRARATAEHAAAVTFEIPIAGRIFHHGWTLTLTGRIDQILQSGPAVTLREVPAKWYAVVRYPGINTQSKVEDKTNELLAWVKTKNWQMVGSPQLSRYDPPWTLPMWRRNELRVEVTAP